MGKYNVVDLFSGCGGFSYGFEQEGFNVVLGVDNWDTALETFKYNHKNSSILNLDLHKKESIKTIKNEVKKHKIDVIIAGPPCQGFSLTGTRDKNDKRNSLFGIIFTKNPLSLSMLTVRLTPSTHIEPFFTIYFKYFLS